MAAFSYDKNHPFLLDSSSMFLFSTHHNPSPLTTNIDNNHNIYNPCFSTHQHHPFHNQPDPTVEVSSSVNISTSSTKVSTLSNNSSSSAVTAQYNQIINPMDKRKNNSKLKGKKQRKETSIDEDQVNNKKKCKRSGDNNNYNQETGYIHVRARRGQATDSHSLAERVRREKISGKMKLLQSLVPGCDKVTGKALMLDEIINYVQSLQNQIEFLSLKITSVNPMLYDFGMDMDAFMVKPEVENQRSSSLEATQQADVQHQNHTQATNNNIFNTSGGYSVMDTSTLHQLQQAYMSNIMSRPQ